MNVDLHCHTNASDGQLAPSAVIQLAAERGVDLLSITDHDTLNAYRQIGAHDPRVTLIPGIEFSSQWRKIGIHILGLNIDPAHPTMVAAASRQTAIREKRAAVIDHKLAALGFVDSLRGARKFAGGGQLGRPHFAEYLVSIGAVKDRQQAFKRYLGAGKAGDIKACWTDMCTVIDWIKGSGGTATLAHPQKYRLTRSKMVALIQDFKAAGGEALEVISGYQTPQLTRDLARLSVQQELLASCGSDFHQLDVPWGALGRVCTLPSHCVPIWTQWSFAE